jgi:putative heme-binding domain-containing protein
MIARLSLASFVLLFGASFVVAQPDAPIKKGDRIAIIGNTLADRMQHDGWLETYLVSRFPNYNLIFRNLGFAADEIAPSLRLRSANFGSPDSWLTQTKADVIFAFFGYNESFAGEAGLTKLDKAGNSQAKKKFEKGKGKKGGGDAESSNFEEELDAQVKHMLKQQYNGKSAPRIVLFAPIAFENLNSPNLPDGKAINKNLALYTTVMAKVAKANNVAFVDLFAATKDALGEATTSPWTLNGVHLNEHGNHEVAKIIDKALAGKQPEPNRTTESLERIRQAVVDKNFYWFNRYRTTDGYSIYGARADLKFVAGQTNRVVMKREMEILDQLTANRDPAVWAAAQGKNYKVDDTNVPEFLPVVTNKGGPLPGGKHLFLSGEAAIAKMKMGSGLKINLFASEKEFPELAAPVQMTWDTKGRLWVAVWPSYPHWKPLDEMNDKILIFEDTDGDGKADKMTVFADKLHNPTGFELWGGGVIVAQVPDILFLKDTDGDGKADTRTRILSGMDSADTHHSANSFVLDPGGALYWQEGTFHRTQVESPWGPPTRRKDAGVFRFEPRTFKFETYVAFGFANPHGHVFDRWGQDIVVDGTGAQPRHATLFSGQVDYPNGHGGPPQVYKQRTRPCSGTEILSSKHFPASFDGNFCVANVIGFQGILRYKLDDDGASIHGVEQEPIVSSTDPNFRPSDLRTGPDGALYFIDWHNPIIGHMQHNLRDPSRDHMHGRIYRVTAEDRPLSKAPKIDGEPIENLLKNLQHPEDRVRYRTRIELTARPTADVIAAASKWIAGLDAKDPEYEHHLMEGLWLHQSHNVVNQVLLERMLRSPDFHARAAATKVLCYQRDRVSDPLEHLRARINDSHPRVRLEAIRAASFFSGEKALSVAVELLAHPTDQYLNYTFNETLNTLERRLGAGKIDRANIAATLVGMLDKAGPERQATLIETICRHGSANELGAIWELVLGPKDLSPALRGKSFEWLADAAATRQVKPNIRLAELGIFLKDARIRPEAIRLAVAWKAKELASEIRALAQEGTTPPDARNAAIDALAAFADADSVKALQALSGPNAPPAVRFRAASGLAQIDIKDGAEAAAKALADAKESDDPSSLVEAFLSRKQGADVLAAALESYKLSSDGAKRVLRSMYLAGRNDTALTAVLSKYAGLDAAFKLPTSAEIRQIGDEAAAQGDPVRGERIFRRAELGCIKCHALHKAGGAIGPDLGPIGGSSPMDYIVQSILDPNSSIKEEYLPRTFVTAAGLVVNGIVIEKTKQHVLLKDATGKKIKIAAADIEEESKGKTLMPEGVTRVLTKGELLDLIRFVADLGKPGPYAMPTATTVQRWRKLREPNAALKSGVPNREVVRDSLLAAPAEAWETAFSLVGGSLPLDEIRKPGSAPEAVYLQSDIVVNTSGKLDVILSGPGQTVFWIDEDAYDKLGATAVTLTPGRHRITVRTIATEGTTPGVRVELRKPADSKVQFELPSGGD